MPYLIKIQASVHFKEFPSFEVVSELFCNKIVYPYNSLTSISSTILSCWIINNFELLDFINVTESHGSWGQKASVEITLFSHSSQSNITKNKFPRTMPSWVLTVCGDGDSTTFLGNLRQCFNFFYTSLPNWNSPQWSFFSPSPTCIREKLRMQILLSLSHRFQKTELCLLYSESFGSGVPTTPSQHLLLLLLLKLLF